MARHDFPDDVYEESGSRLPRIRREALDDESRALFDRLVDPAGVSIAGLRGPGGIRLYSARVSEFNQGFLRYFRREAALAGRVRELAILVTAREHDCQFEWGSHLPLARREGIEPEIIETVARRGSLDGIAEPDALVIRLGRELFGERRVAPETFARALAQFGARDLVDLVSLMSQYSATASLLCAFDVQPDPDAEPLPPRAIST